MTESIRIASPDGADAMLAIYAPIVRDNAISFELEPPTRHAMGQRVADIIPMLPWLVTERDQKVVAYA